MALDMTHKITIQTIKGQSDSLKRDVKIAFAFTPKKSKGTYAPVAVACMVFPRDSEKSRVLEWNRKLSFATWDAKAGGTTGRCTLRGDRSPTVPAGSVSQVSRTVSGSHWGDVAPNSAKTELSMAVAKDTGLYYISLIKHITCGQRSSYLPIGAWLPSHNTRVGSSSDLLLQAYIINNSDSDGIILGADDRKRPLFREDLSCDALPETSAWRLMEDRDGVIRLTMTNKQPTPRVEVTSPRQTTKTQNTPLEDMREQLDLVINVLEDTQERLQSVEKAFKTSQVELREAQTSLEATQAELARLALGKSKFSVLAASLGRVVERLDVVEKSVFKSQEDLTTPLENSTGLFGLETSLVPRVDDPAPVIDAKANDLNESTSLTQDQLLAACENAGIALDQVDPLNRDPPSVRDTSDILEAPASKSRDRLSALEESLGLVSQRLDAVEGNVGSKVETTGSRMAHIPSQSPSILKPSSPVHEGFDISNEAISTVRRQVAALDRRIPVMEAKVVRLEKSFGIMERKVPTVEEKVTRVERLFDRTHEEQSSLQISLDFTREELTGLGSRVADMEMKTDQLGEPWHRSRPSSPSVFPSRG